MKDYTLNTDKFNRPKVLEGQDAIYTFLVRLALLEKGTLQSHPDMGLGITRYRYTSDVNALVVEYKKQIQTYLPELKMVDVQAKIVNHVLQMQVQIDSTIYPIDYDLEKQSFEDFNN